MKKVCKPKCPGYLDLFLLQHSFCVLFGSKEKQLSCLGTNNQTLYNCARHRRLHGGLGGSVWVMGEWSVSQWILGVMRFQKIFGLYGVERHKVEKWSG